MRSSTFGVVLISRGGDCLGASATTAGFSTTLSVVLEEEGVLVGAFLRGPRARPFVICVSCGPGSVGSEAEVLILAVR